LSTIDEPIVSISCNLYYSASIEYVMLTCEEMKSCWFKVWVRYQ